jgi:hypothetical protein
MSRKFRVGLSTADVAAFFRVFRVVCMAIGGACGERGGSSQER